MAMFHEEEKWCSRCEKKTDHFCNSYEDGKEIEECKDCGWYKDNTEDKHLPPIF